MTERPSAPSRPLGHVADDTLVERVRSGDRHALAELFQRHRLTAYRVAWRLTGNEADALDAVQEGFIKALTGVTSFAGRACFKTWLLRIVSNTALDMLRSRRRREAVSLFANEDVPEPALAAPLCDSSEELNRAEMRRILDEALAGLPEVQRQTFVLFAEAGLRYREIADILGVSIGTVMSRLFYARQRLRAWLTEHSTL